MDVLKNIFGGADPDDHEQRAQRYQQGYSSGQFDDLDEQDVQERYRRTVQHAPPEMVAQAHEEAFRRLPPEERQRVVGYFQQAADDPRQPYTHQFSGGPQDYDPRQMAQMAGRAREQQPDLLQGLGGVLSNPMAKMALAGVAAVAAQRMMGGGRR